MAAEKAARTGAGRRGKLLKLGADVGKRDGDRHGGGRYTRPRAA